MPCVLSFYTFFLFLFIFFISRLKLKVFRKHMYFFLCNWSIFVIAYESYRPLSIFIFIFKNQYFEQCNISSVCNRRYYNKCTAKESTSQIKIWTPRTMPLSRAPILISNTPSKDSSTITTEKMWEYIIDNCLFRFKKTEMFYMLSLMTLRLMMNSFSKSSWQILFRCLR